MSSSEKKAAELGKSEENTEKIISLGEVFKFAGSREKKYFFVALLGVALASFGWPLLNIIFGLVLDLFLNFEKDIKNVKIGINRTLGEDEIRSRFLKDIGILSAEMLGVAALYVSSMFVILFCFNRFSLRVVRTVRQKYIDSILRQDIAWMDTKQSGEFATVISSHFKKFETGINENLGLMIFNIVSSCANIVTAFLYGWKLSLVLMSAIPMMGISSWIVSKFQKRFQHSESEADSKASAALEEIFTAIRTVFAFSGQAKEVKRYRELLKPATKNAILRHHASSYAQASSWCFMYINIGIGLWYGIYLIHNEGMTPGDFIIIFWSAMGAGFSLSSAAPYYESFQTARMVATDIYKIMERKPAIDSGDEGGQIVPEDLKANIEFRDVHFCYPTRPDVKILNGIDLKIEQGETIAIVGSSGSGKSTLVQLIQRFYDPDCGGVFVDGVNIKHYNLGSLRHQLGVVGQEAILFDASIEDNIRLGLAIDQMNTADKETIVRAAKQANAHNFIVALPEGYNTRVGDRGAQLSGGQKQRVAIARALVSNPCILLLDESTSALDNESEKLVQKALDEASKGRTTIIVAHRLSTIRNADRIVHLDKGTITEVGTHQQLMDKKGAYYNLVTAQQITGVDDVHSSKTRSRLLSSSSHKSLVEESILKVDGEDQEKKKLIEEVKKSSFPYRRLASYIGKDRFLLAAAMVCAFVYGLIIPIYAILFGEFVDMFSKSDDPDYQSRATRTYSTYYFVLAAVSLAVMVAQSSLFGFVSERLIKRLRVMAFKTLMNQEMEFFDAKQNTPGALVSRLSEDVANIQGATGMRLSILCSIVSTVLAAIFISFYFNWPMSLVSIAVCPFVVWTAFAAAKQHSRQHTQDSATSEKLGKLLIEVINGKRTIDSLNKGKYFYSKFNAFIEDHYRLVVRGVWLRFVFVSFSFSSLFISYAVSYIFGGLLMYSDWLTSGDFFRVIESIIIGAQVIGNAAILSADFTKAKLGAHSFFNLIDRPTSRDFESVCLDGEKLPVQGKITAEQVHFSYPNRPGVTILNGLSLQAQPGQTLALVGESGCGKSTFVCQLLELFYRPTCGQIMIDGRDLGSYDVNWIRSQMALVQQEPILFNYSIRDNIAYGDNARDNIAMDEIVRAAQMANIHEFIQQLPLGYDTPVGAKGSQLSGGQKQRIAIARSLLRNPCILLLDEATSALDTESEKIVQQALDKASQGRTCIVVAHRLKTIVNAHNIVVMHKGVCVEQGTHDQLLARKGLYHKLYSTSG